MIPAFALLTPEERQLMDEWQTTPHRDGAIGEAAISIIGAFVEGCGYRRVVELGRNEGYGTLLIGWMLRRSGGRMISFDIAPDLTERSRAWIARAGLDVRVELGDSRDPKSAALALECLGDAPQLVILDTSHECGQTMLELELWYGALAPGGVILLHDSSMFAERYDTTGMGGVRAGLREWLAAIPGVQCLNLNEDVTEWGQGVYPDGNGLAILTKGVQ